MHHKGEEVGQKHYLRSPTTLPSLCTCAHRPKYFWPPPEKCSPHFWPPLRKRPLNFWPPILGAFLGSSSPWFLTLFQRFLHSVQPIITGSNLVQKVAKVHWGFTLGFGHFHFLSVRLNPFSWLAFKLFLPNQKIGKNSPRWAVSAHVQKVQKWYEKTFKGVCTLRAFWECNSELIPISAHVHNEGKLNLDPCTLRAFFCLHPYYCTCALFLWLSSFC